jgi:hypothetical protein
MSRFKFLLANGDSYVAGADTALDEFYPRFSQLYLPNDKAKKNIHQWDAWPKAISKDQGKFAYYCKKCLEYSYPSQLASLLDISSMNIAVSGQSNSVTAATTIGYIEDHLLSKYQPEEILVLVGLTSFDRLKVPSPANAEYDDIPTQYGCKSMILKYQNRDIPYDVQDYFETATDRYLALENIVTILGLIDYLKIRNISYIITESSLYNRWIGNIDTKFPERFNELFYMPEEKLRFQSVINSCDQIVTEFDHYGKEAHVRFAKILHEHINETFL